MTGAMEESSRLSFDSGLRTSVSALASRLRELSLLLVYARLGSCGFQRLSLITILWAFPLQGRAAACQTLQDCDSNVRDLT